MTKNDIKFRQGKSKRQEADAARLAGVSMVALALLFVLLIIDTHLIN